MPLFPLLVGGIEVRERRPRYRNEPRYKRLDFIRPRTKTNTDEWDLIRTSNPRVLQQQHQIYQGQMDYPQLPYQQQPQIQYNHGHGRIEQQYHQQPGGYPPYGHHQQQPPLQGNDYNQPPPPPPPPAMRQIAPVDDRFDDVNNGPIAGERPQIQMIEPRYDRAEDIIHVEPGRGPKIYMPPRNKDPVRQHSRSRSKFRSKSRRRSSSRYRRPQDDYYSSDSSDDDDRYARARQGHGRRRSRSRGRQQYDSSDDDSLVRRYRLSGKRNVGHIGWG